MASGRDHRDCPEELSHLADRLPLMPPGQHQSESIRAHTPRCAQQTSGRSSGPSLISGIELFESRLPFRPPGNDITELPALSSASCRRAGELLIGPFTPAP